MNLEQGVNLIGYTRAEFGLGEACRSAAKSLESVNIPFCIINFPFCSARQDDQTWIDKEVRDPIYNTNLFFINADQLYYHYRKNTLKRSWFNNRYNIGYWHWELPEFPDIWRRSFNLVNEIWVPSIFTADSISKKTTKPVGIIPHAISLDIPENINRLYFGLPNNRYLFLTMFDFHSTLARKNPYAVIEAFKHTFNKDDDKVGLVLKINNASHFLHEVEQLKQNIGDYQNIFIMDKILNRKELNGLIYSTDCYVSLHRAEGFGLPLAEAMFLQKPVIATNWSGNIDFMDHRNSLLVNYTIKRIRENYGPYSPNQYWAEPDISHASELMNKIVDDVEYGKCIGMLGKKIIENKFSHQVIGESYKLRLSQLTLI